MANINFRWWKWKEKKIVRAVIGIGIVVLRRNRGRKIKK